MQQKDKCWYNKVERPHILAQVTHYFSILIKEPRNKTAADSAHIQIHWS
jgi:hypothetical protein